MRVPCHPLRKAPWSNERPPRREDRAGHRRRPRDRPRACDRLRRRRSRGPPPRPRGSRRGRQRAGRLRAGPRPAMRRLGRDRDPDGVLEPRPARRARQLRRGHGLDRCAGSRGRDLGSRDRHESQGNVLLLERGCAPDARDGRLDRQRHVGARDQGNAELGGLCGQQGRDQLPHSPARDRARTSSDPRQRLRAGRDERRAEPHRRSRRTSRPGRL